jgi:prepilin-type N-terminal cleavage/methylation domain-containing protein
MKRREDRGERGGIRDWGLGIGRKGSGFRVQGSGLIPNPQSLIPSNPQSPIPNRSGFTLVEMLVTVTIIGILTGVVFGALQLARNAAREAATKATIAKLDAIITQRYESYLTRRVPIRIPPTLTPRQAAEVRLAAIRDLMRMEMPERYNDIISAPSPLPNGVPALSEPALHRLYKARYDAHDPGSAPSCPAHAECLYLLVSLASPEAMEQFSQSEIGDTDNNGWMEFLDGWGKPIYFLRWAPGCSAKLPDGSPNPNGCSEIQSGNPTTDHDPFDTRNVDPDGFRLIPLIYSFGRNGTPNVLARGSVVVNYVASDIKICTSTAYQEVGRCDPPGSSAAKGNITNHHIEMR